jgi:hypothetical protein
MNFDQFETSLTQSAPPSGLSLALQALWWDAKGDWDKAHECAQVETGANGAWVHAYLHRREGDLGNAGYWYRQAGKPPATTGLAEEWRAIVLALL